MEHLPIGLAMEGETTNLPLFADIMTLLPTESGVIHLKASRINQSQTQLFFSDVPFGPTMVRELPTCRLTSLVPQSNAYVVYNGLCPCTCKFS